MYDLVYGYSYGVKYWATGEKYSALSSYEFFATSNTNWLW